MNGKDLNTPKVKVAAQDVSAAPTDRPPPNEKVRATVLFIKMIFLVGIVATFFFVPEKLDTYQAAILGGVVNWLMNSLTKADNFHWGTATANGNRH